MRISKTIPGLFKAAEAVQKATAVPFKIGIRWARHPPINCFLSKWTKKLLQKCFCSGFSFMNILKPDPPVDAFGFAFKPGCNSNLLEPVLDKVL